MQPNSVQSAVYPDNTSPRKTVLLFREHCLFDPLITRIFESLGYRLAFIEELLLSTHSITKPSIIVLDDCLSSSTIEQYFDVLKTRFNAPIIYLTEAYVRQADHDHAMLGCDDFILKPFNLKELQIRMECTIRRYKNYDGESLQAALVERRQKPTPASSLPKSYFSINKAARLVYIEGQAIRLTPKEYQLFCLLSANQGQIYSTEAIIQYLWPDNKKAAPNDVQQFIYCLRKKIEKVPTKPCFLHNVPGYGYKLEYLPTEQMKPLKMASC